MKYIRWFNLLITILKHIYIYMYTLHIWVLWTYAYSWVKGPVARCKQIGSSLDRLQALGQLFEEWLSAGEDFTRTSIVMEAQRVQRDKKRAKMVMKSFKSLKEEYGEKKAKDIRVKKYLAEKSRDPNLDPDPWHFDHPELGDDKARPWQHSNLMSK